MATAKLLDFEDHARQRLKAGLDIVANAVKVTLGPKGRNVALGRKYDPPIVTHDGVTVAKAIELVDPFENMGAQLLKEAAIKTNDVAGDGTTTATILAQAIVHEGMKNIAAGANPMLLRYGLELATETAVQALEALATPVEHPDEIAQIATISAGSAELGKLIGEAFARVDKEGIITVVQGQTLHIEAEYTEGMTFDRGFLSPYFITDTSRSLVEIEDPYILIAEKKLSATTDILPTLERLVEVSQNLVIIAEEIETDALATLVINRVQGGLNALAVKIPGSGDKRKETVRDMAIYTGATLISDQTGYRLEDVQIEHLGRARRVTATQNDTTIVQGLGDELAIQNRIAEVRELLRTAISAYDTEKFQERLARLTGAAAVIKVGAATETEQKERQHRVEDALAAARAAIADGIVPGGGVALLKAAAALDNLSEEGDIRTGVAILRRALEEPLRVLAANAGLDGSVIIAEVRRLQADGNTNIGFDVLRNEYGDMLTLGIIDPLKVTRSALQSAASVASLVITTEALVVEQPDDLYVKTSRPTFNDY